MFAAALPAISPQAVESVFALAIGFAFAGSCANGYRLFGEHFPSFRLLESGPAAARFAAIPLLVFAAPFIIMRNSVPGWRIERRRAQMVMVATVNRRPVEPDVRDRGGDGVRGRHPGLTDRRQAADDRLGELRVRPPSTGVRISLRRRGRRFARCSRRAGDAHLVAGHDAVRGIDDDAVVRDDARRDLDLRAKVA
jgi:hypothetical protein